MDATLIELENPDPDEVLRLVGRETPFVMRGLCRDWPALATWDLATLARKLKDAPGKVYKSTWRTREGALHEDIPTAEAVRRVLYDDAHFRIAENMAIWLSAAGNVTTMHYDGYSYDGFNVQVTGHKTFELCHPDLECVMAPFLQGAMPRPGDAEARRRVVSYKVELRPGDCLYTPRFWYHTVTAHTDATNVQYHFARRAPPAVASRARRNYANNAWVVVHAPWLIPGIVRVGISEYPEIVALYAAEARPSEALAQAARAIARMLAQVIARPLETRRFVRQYSRKTVEELGRPIA